MEARFAKGVPPMESLSQSLSVWLQTSIFWIVIVVLFLGLEMVNRRMVLFFPVAIASLAVAALVQPLPAGWPQFGIMPKSWVGVLALWALISLIGSTACMMMRRRRSRRRARRKRLTRA